MSEAAARILEDLKEHHGMQSQAQYLAKSVTGNTVETTKMGNVTRDYMEQLLGNHVLNDRIRMQIHVFILEPTLGTGWELLVGHCGIPDLRRYHNRFSATRRTALSGDPVEGKDTVNSGYYGPAGAKCN